MLVLNLQALALQRTCRVPYGGRTGCLLRRCGSARRVTRVPTEQAPSSALRSTRCVQKPCSGPSHHKTENHTHQPVTHLRGCSRPLHDGQLLFAYMDHSSPGQAFVTGQPTSDLRHRYVKTFFIVRGRSLPDLEQSLFQRKSFQVANHFSLK